MVGFYINLYSKIEEVFLTTKKYFFTEGISCTCKILGNIQTINQTDYMLVKTFDVSGVDLKNFKVNMTGLLPDPDLNTFALEFINQNWKALYADVVVQTRAIWEPIFLSLINCFFERVPFEQLMPK